MNLLTARSMLDDMLNQSAAELRRELEMVNREFTSARAANVAQAHYIDQLRDTLVLVRALLKFAPPLIYSARNVINTVLEGAELD